MRNCTASAFTLAACCLSAPFAAPAAAATLTVAAGGDLQTALDRAQPGDVILLAAGAEFVGNFTLPVKSGSGFIVVRSSTADSRLPGPGERVTPSHAPLLARLRSPNSAAALSTVPGSHHWMLQYLGFGPNKDGFGDIIQIGDGSKAQNSLTMVPRQFVLDHLYVHGDPFLGQKRCIALNGANVTVRDSYVSDCKGVGMDTQAIGGWNGPGPYLIENNYLEGAGENVIFGGADPGIPNLVAENVVVRRNLMSKPLEWRDPIVPSPAAPTVTAETGGSLAAGTYGYRIVAYRKVGQGSVGRSTASIEVRTSVSAGGAIRVRWSPVAGATEYRVYGRTPAAQSMYWRVAASEFVDTGVGGVSEAVPTTPGTRWTVKNIFELKNARNVVVEYNIFENNWQKDQAGYAIVFTPRNSGGACTWCTVEDVTFHYNVVRNVAAGFNILGYDSPEITAQANNIQIRHNLFIGVTKAMGGNGWFMLIGGEPRDVIVDHNTVDHDGTSFIYVYGGTETAPKQVLGVRVTNNAARHGSYGMNGEFFAYGNAILAGFYPQVVFLGNYLAGGSASRYPAGNLFSGAFESQFVNAAAGNFQLAPGSLLTRAATDGANIGADVTAVLQATASVDHGAPTPAPRSPSPPGSVQMITR
jgi:hypothetical protein